MTPELRAIRRKTDKALRQKPEAPTSGPGRVLPDVPPIKLKTTHIPDRMAAMEARAEAKAS